VQEIEIRLADGRSLVFALDMAAFALLEDEHEEGAFVFLQSMFERIKTRPVAAFCEVLYLGLRVRQPELTMDELKRIIPFDMDIMNEIYDALNAFLPSNERPTIPSLELT
jgi:hypothetical protein